MIISQIYLTNTKQILDDIINISDHYHTHTWYLLHTYLIYTTYIPDVYHTHTWLVPHTYLIVTRIISGKYQHCIWCYHNYCAVGATFWTASNEEKRSRPKRSAEGARLDGFLAESEGPIRVPRLSCFATTQTFSSPQSGSGQPPDRAQICSYVVWWWNRLILFFSEPVSGPPNVNFQRGNAKKSVKKSASTRHVASNWSKLGPGSSLGPQDIFSNLRVNETCQLPWLYCRPARAPDPTATPPRCRPSPRCPQMAGPDGLPFILAPITFSWGGVVWEGVSETARGVVGWGKGARPFAMSPIAASYSGVLGACHLSPCSDLCIVREFGAARGHPVGRAYHSMTPSHRIHNVLSVYISALSLMQLHE